MLCFGTILRVSITTTTLTAKKNNQKFHRLTDEIIRHLLCTSFVTHCDLNFRKKIRHFCCCLFLFLSHRAKLAHFRLIPPSFHSFLSIWYANWIKSTNFYFPRIPSKIICRIQHIFDACQFLFHRKRKFLLKTTKTHIIRTQIVIVYSEIHGVCMWVCLCVKWSVLDVLVSEWHWAKKKKNDEKFDGVRLFEMEICMGSAS